eukprot:TRINITY_DN775_c0_g1_i1.p2 TRINITY_DN775_c0_g1~~TRINITY_DN775_c0_g1_i1.p2  ORF type:complete len:1425 (-),score=235.92 TRINITY_DN775_c0_g1_i1:18735-23009(-)
MKQRNASTKMVSTARYFANSLYSSSEFAERSIKVIIEKRLEGVKHASAKFQKDPKIISCDFESIKKTEALFSPRRITARKQEQSFCRPTYRIFRSPQRHEITQRTPSAPMSNGIVYERFNEVPSKKPRLWRESVLPRGEVLGIGIDPMEPTVLPPSLVKERAELNKEVYYHDPVWKNEKKQYGVEIQSPANFPLRSAINFIEERKKKAAELEKNHEQIKRPCHDLVKQIKAELEEKKKEVSNFRKAQMEKLDFIRAERKNRVREEKEAYFHDKNASGRKKETIGISTESNLRVITLLKSTGKIPLKPKVFDPHLVSIIFHEDTTGRLFGPSTGTDTVLISFANTEGTPQANIQSILQLAELSYTNNNIANANNVNVESAQYFATRNRREIVILLPKAVTFGDTAPREPRKSEYAENFVYYRIDPEKIVEYLKEQKLDPTAPMSMSKLKDILAFLGLPLNSKEEIDKYAEMLEKEKNRKERIEMAKKKEEKERKLKQEEKEQNHFKKMQEVMRESQAKKDKIMDKQRTISEKLKELSEQKKEEKIKRHKNKEEHRFLVNQRAEIKAFIIKDVLQPIISAAVNKAKTFESSVIEKVPSIHVTKQAKKSSQTRYEDYSHITRHDGNETILKCISRKVQTPTEWNLNSTFKVDVGYDVGKPEGGSKKFKVHRQIIEESELKNINSSNSLQDSEDFDRSQQQKLEPAKKLLDEKKTPSYDRETLAKFTNAPLKSGVRNEGTKQTTTTLKKEQTKENSTRKQPEPTSEEELEATMTGDKKQTKKRKKKKGKKGSKKKEKVVNEQPHDNTNKATPSDRTPEPTHVIPTTQKDAKSPKRQLDSRPSPKSTFTKSPSQIKFTISKPEVKKSPDNKVEADPPSTNAPNTNNNLFKSTLVRYLGRPTNNPLRPQSKLGHAKALLDASNLSHHTDNKDASNNSMHSAADPEGITDVKTIKAENPPKMKFRIEYDPEETIKVQPQEQQEVKQKAQSIIAQMPTPIQKPAQKAETEKRDKMVKLSIKELKKNLASLQGVGLKLPTPKPAVEKPPVAPGLPKAEKVAQPMSPSKNQKKVSAEEEQLAQAFALLLKKQEEEAEKLKGEKQGRLNIELDASPISSGTEEYDPAAFMNTITSNEKNTERIKRRLTDPKKFTLIAHTIGKDEDLQNIVMQRSEADLEALANCEELLGKFFVLPKVQDMLKEGHKQPKFTPFVEITEEVEEEEPTTLCRSPQGRASQKGELAWTGLDTAELKIATNKAKILAQNIKMLGKLIGKVKSNYEDLLDEENNQVDEEDSVMAKERFKKAGKTLVIIEKMMQERQKHFEQLHRMHLKEANPSNEAEFSRGLIRSAFNSNRGSETGLRGKELVEDLQFPAISRKQSGKVCRKYKVNLDVLKKREEMSQLEILERRSHYWPSREAFSSNSSQIIVTHKQCC